MSCSDEQVLDGKELPELHQGELDLDGLASLFRDLAALTEVIEIIAKGAPTARASTGPLGLAEAHDLLREGALRAVQVRYRHDGAEWWDTVMAGPRSFRVVRIRQDWGS